MVSRGHCGDVHALAPQVDFVLNTGDCVMDALEVDKEPGGEAVGLPSRP